jgi:tRNA pseudouridine55 synthase
MQVPPMFSAQNIMANHYILMLVKILKLIAEPKKRQIYEINYISLKSDILEFSVVCSSGTYIRTLVQDISKQWDLHSCLYSFA